MSTENEKEFSYVLPSIFVDSHQQPTDLTIMGAAAAYRRAHPDAPMVDSKQSEALKDGSILLRDILGAGLALVTVDGNVRLIEEDGDHAPDGHGIEVHEAAPEPVVILALVQTRVITTWRCGCGVGWKKVGHHIGATKRCRSCGRESVLRAPN
jgi:hypothetical protein